MGKNKIQLSFVIYSYDQNKKDKEFEDAEALWKYLKATNFKKENIRIIENCNDTKHLGDLFNVIKKDNYVFIYYSYYINYGSYHFRRHTHCGKTQKEFVKTINNLEYYSLD